MQKIIYSLPQILLRHSWHCYSVYDDLEYYYNRP